MRQNKLHQDTFINKFLNEKDLNFKNEVINIPFKPAPYQKKLSEVDKALNKAKKHIEAKRYFAAKNQLIKVFKEKKTIENALLISECFTKLREFEKAVKFFEQNLAWFETNGTYWGILALHNYASEDFEGAAGSAYNAIEKCGLELIELWKIFVHSSKKIERRDVLYHTCKKRLPNEKETSFNNIIKNPFLIEGYLTACFDVDRREGWEFVEKTGINIQNVEKFGEVSGVISGIIASLIPDSQERLKDALAWNTRAKELDPHNSYIRWNLSDLQLKSGLIDEGVENYECRFLWDQFPSYIRTFKKPHWHPNAQKNAKIMVWYEQGIGDQIRFMSAIKNFQKDFPNLIIETSEKTFSILKHSFPDIEVRISTMDDDLTTPVEDFDYHIPSGTLFYHVIQKNSYKLQDNTSTFFNSFLLPDKLRQDYWKNKLNSQTTKPKIGLCWTSGMQNTRRLKHYTTLEKWTELIEHDGFSFVNLQYNLSVDELFAKGNITRNFLNTGFLDQKDDLEGVVSLLSNLDYVISTSSSPSMLASAVGVPTVIFSAINIDWLGRSEKFDQHPLFSNTLIYPTLNAESDKKIVPDIISLLEKKLLT